MQRWVTAVLARDSMDAVILTTAGDFYVAPGNGSDGAFQTFQLALKNFTTARGAGCAGGPMMVAARTNMTEAQAICVSEDAGYWYKAI